jgi:hypothetical protein
MGSVPPLMFEAGGSGEGTPSPDPPAATGRHYPLPFGGLFLTIVTITKPVTAARMEVRPT